MNLLSIATSGMNNAVQRFERGVGTLLRGVSNGEGDAVRGLVDTIEARTQFKASAALVRVSDQMMADLLEIQRDR